MPSFLTVIFLLLPAAAHAADLNGATLSVWWALPFAGMLLSIALGPLIAPSAWHHHYGKIACACGVLFLAPAVMAFGTAALTATLHALIAEYIPFIVILTALFAVAGGICVRGNLHGTPWLNTRILMLGTALASLMGTTGAAMLLIRPLIRANDNRKHNIHVFVFFIFLVANAGGALTPLGDPPLFLGFLQGVDFFWTLKNLWAPTAVLCCILLAVFYLVDTYLYRRQDELTADVTPDAPVTVDGKFNFLLLAAIIGLVLMSGLWKPGITYSLAGIEVELQNLVRDGGLLGITCASLWLTPAQLRTDNGFNWEPMREVAKLFAAIFLTIIPVIAMLKAGEQGVFAPVIRAVIDSEGQPNNLMYFWATGLLSAFLDNAPTYLVFFNTTGGEAQILMSRFAGTLAAISCGAVFMGALTYIGNAPNMMVRAIAVERGIAMPSFFAYLGWSCAILLPVFALLSFLFFH